MRRRRFDINKIYVCLILVLVCLIGIGFSIIQSKPKMKGTARIAAYIPMAFTNQTLDAYFSTSEQNVSMTEAIGGSGRFMYMEKSEKNSNGVDTNYISLSGKTIVIDANTPIDTYTYVITATDLDSTQTIDATITINVQPQVGVDTWVEFVENVQSGNTSMYSVGFTKEVDMGSYGVHTLRIANMSTPSECSNTDFSQTACGLVLEFADIIIDHRMNPFSWSDSSIDGTVDGSGNKGGWEHSEMRTYLNTTIYNALPASLKNAILNTKVVSGHGSNDTDNYVTTDKLYLLAPKEVWNSNYSYNSDNNNTRQLDYYNDIGVSTVNYSGAIKKKGNTPSIWWLRSANQYNDNGFNRVGSDGNVDYIGSNNNSGVSPAFRIS